MKRATASAGAHSMVQGRAKKQLAKCCNCKSAAKKKQAELLEADCVGSDGEHSSRAVVVEAAPGRGG